MRLSSRSQAWLDKAWQDIYSAECLIKHHPAPYEVICFLCQQAVEKSLKCVLSFYGEEPPRTHDCAILCALCGEHDMEFKAWKDKCSRFAPFSVVVRYPNELEVNETDARWALKAGQDIYEFAVARTEMSLKEEPEQNA